MVSAPPRKSRRSSFMSVFYDCGGRSCKCGRAGLTCRQADPEVHAMRKRMLSWALAAGLFGGGVAAANAATGAPRYRGDVPEISRESRQLSSRAALAAMKGNVQEALRLAD